MTFPSFPEFFEAANDGWGPFPWQARLASIVATDGWPEAFEVPTGLGKTAVIDIAVWMLASEAARRLEERRARTRTFFVVDRRLVVDQAYDHAMCLCDRLEDPPAGPLAEVAAALKNIGEPDARLGERVLSVTRMRGGTTWASRWVRRPDLPALVLGTVDQLGSRALFRGYGVGHRRLPIDAALVGTDSLIVVDEVHLSQAFVETLAAVQALEAACTDPVPRPLRLVRMSATLPDRAATALVGDEDRAHRDAGARLRASKRARLVEVAPKTAPAVIAALGLGHLRPGASGGADSVAIVVNTVSGARAVFAAVGASGVDAVLLVGRVRPVDRERIAGRLAPFRARATRSDSDPRVLVATQTVEVGVDLDVGALVSQAAPLDSLVQRLGRLDRLGGRSTSEVTVVRIAEDDPVYGEPAATTWEVLTRLAGGPVVLGAPPRSLGELGPPRIDLGTDALEVELAGVDRRSLVARTEPGPVVLPPVLDVWARTAPVPEPDEPVAAYLHGFERPAALVSVAWRAVEGAVDPEQVEDALSHSLATVSLRSEEQVEVPLWDVVAFLEGRDAGADADVAVETPAPSEEGGFRFACVRVTDEGAEPCRRRSHVVPGAMLVLPSVAGGYDEWGWTGRVGAGAPVEDVADLCAPYGTLRLSSAVLASLGVAGETLEEVRDIVRSVRSSDDTGDPDDLLDAGRAGVETVMASLDGAGAPSHVGLGECLDRASRALGDPRRSRVVVERDDEGACLVVRWKVAKAAGGGFEFDEGAGSDAVGAVTSGTGRRVALEAHSRAVRDRARAIGTHVGLPRPLLAAVELASLAHDLGKADPRFQLSLWRGDRLAQEAHGGLLAKSDQPRGRHTRDWPPGLRHEALSATVLDGFVDASHAGDVDLQLVRHLVLAHHGHARPLLPAASERDGPVPFRMPAPEGDGVLTSAGLDRQVDWEHPHRFRALCRRYGWWGLALLETIVRSADVCASEEDAGAGEDPS